MVMSDLEVSRRQFDRHFHWPRRSGDERTDQTKMEVSVSIQYGTTDFLQMDSQAT